MKVNMHRIVITVNYPQLKRYQTKFENSGAQSYSFERCTSLNCAIASNLRHELVHLITYCCTVMTNNKPLVEIDENPHHNKFFRKILFNCFDDNSEYHTFEEYNYKSTWMIYQMILDLDHKCPLCSISCSSLQNKINHFYETNFNLNENQ